MIQPYRSTATLASSFDIIPAIDLRGGRVVRLEQGSFDRETAFSDDPVAVARRFLDGGARWLHVVDLDGARTGRSVHGSVIRSIIEAVGDNASIEVAGGLRSEADVGAILDAGAARAVIGTRARRDQGFVQRCLAAHGPAAIIVALDVRQGHAYGEAWSPGAAGGSPAGALITLADTGVMTFEVTAIERDGLLVGPDLGLMRGLVGLGRGAVIASGGIASLGDIDDLIEVGCSGAIVGRALYDGSLDLRDALARAAGTSQPTTTQPTTT